MNLSRIFILLSVGLVSLALLMGCSRTSNEKIADAKANEVEAKQQVNEAVADARTDAEKTAAREEWLEFKRAAEVRMAENDRIIAAYKASMTSTEGKLRAEYDRKIDDLENLNRELKAKLNAYQDSGKNAWEKFKSEFSHDTDELGVALKGFTVEQKK